MAEDIRLSVNFWTHPKTVKLFRKGGLEAVRSLQILWCFCAQERTDGVLSGIDAEDIEIAADWQGDEGRLVELLVTGNWLERLEDGTYALHGWEERQAYVSKAESRKGQARVAAEVRWRKKRGVHEQMPDSDSAYADSCEQHCSQHNEHHAEHMLEHNEHHLPDLKAENADSCEQHADSNAPFLNIQEFNIKSIKALKALKALRHPPSPLASEGGDDAASRPSSGSREDGTSPRAQGTNPRKVRMPQTYSQAFEAFWQAYPRKVGKDAAFRAWKRKRHELPPPEELAAILARQCHCEQRQRDGGQYIPHPATWLNQGRWQDVIETTAGQAMDDPEGW